MSSGVLYLVPVPLTTQGTLEVIPRHTLSVIQCLNVFLVENAKTARRWLKHFEHPLRLQEVRCIEIDKHGQDARSDEALRLLREGISIGLMSEAGCPAIADPGATFVSAAHAKGIRVVPLVGPSSILLALMASGLSGQRFAFHGYLPIEREGRRKKIMELERLSQARDETQIFIETPYRNSALFSALTQLCGQDTLLSIARDLTGPDELIATKTIREWRSITPDLKNRPTVFLIHSKPT